MTPGNIYNAMLFSNHTSATIYSKAATVLVFFLFSLVFFLSPASAQTDEWVWAQSTGGIFNEARGERVVCDNNGHVVVAGTYSCPQITFGSITLNNNGGDDLFVVKMDTGGNVLWAKSAGGDYAEEGYTVATDDAGNVYVSGEFWSESVTFGSSTITNSGSADIFLVKYDASGNVLWAKSPAGTDEDKSNAIAVDLAGNVYITGSYISNTLDFGGGVTLSNSQSNAEDMFIAKYDADGNAVWAKHATGSGNDKAFGIGTDADGNVLVSGHFISGTLAFGSTTLFNSGGFDIFLVKYDANGNVLWAKNPSGSGYDFNFSLELDANGNSYITGHFSSFQLIFGGATVTNGGGDDIYVAKYDANGNAMWAQKAGGNTYDYGYDVSVDGQGNVFLTGNFHSPTISFGNISLTNSTTYADFYVVKYNSSGDPQWAQHGTGSDYTFGRGCGADASGNVYVTGLFGNETLTLGNLTLTTYAGATDLFIARYGSSNCTTIFYADADNDSYGNAAVTITACTPPAGYVSDSTDCNDADPNIYGPATWFLDADGDSYGQPEINLVVDCIQPAGYVSNNDDCDDTNAAINPGAVEIPNNGIDDDCDGLIDEFGTGINIITTESPSLQLSPNLTSGIFNIYLNLNNHQGSNATITLYTLAGKKVIEQQVNVKDGEVKEAIDLSSITAEGMYLLTVKVLDAVTLQERIWTGRIVYQK
ncbi:MAG TPA: MopE-related protein [Chitinophagales bacterium]|nr:MopE-related protein [Chitinophagales bacterium]